MADDGEVNWNVDLEVSLFHAMRRHKPVGVNRHFQMVFIHDKLNNSISRKISSKQIWTHLMEMYDLQALNESEILPFPNKDLEFRLPEFDYGDLMNRDYPRAPRDDRSAPAEDPAPTPTHSHGKGKSRDRDRDKDRESRGEKDKEASSTPSHVARAHEAEDSPKREQRKRTRQSLVDSPATTRERDTPTPKRARRT